MANPLSCTQMLVDWGLVLSYSQTQEDGTERVIAYASRTLSKSEKNYPAYKLEFLALSGQFVTDFMNIYTGEVLKCLQITTPLHTS